MPCRRLYSTSAASCLLLFPGRGPCTLREAGPNRLGHCASIQRRATRHPLDVPRARVVAYGALLSHGSCELPAPAEATASPEDTGCSRLRIPTWVTRYSCGARPRRISCINFFFYWESTDQNSRPLVPTPHVAFPFLLKLFFTYRICYLCLK